MKKSNAENQRACMDKKKIRGLCVHCGKRPPFPNRTRCKLCLRINAKLMYDLRQRRKNKL